MVRKLKHALGGKWVIPLVIFFFTLSSVFFAGNDANARVKKYNIAVKIISSDPAVRTGVTVAVTNSVQVNPLTTKKNGKVLFRKLIAGTYTITPTKDGYSFTPSSKPITFGKKITETATFTGAKVVIPVTEESVAISNPASGTYFAAGEKPVITISLPDQNSRSDYSSLSLYVYGPQETAKTVTAVKLLNASTDRTQTPHHYINLLTDTNVQVNDNILTVPWVMYLQKRPSPKPAVAIDCRHP